MNPTELEGKKVVDTGAKIVGTLTGIEIDCSEWKVTNLRVELADELVEKLGYKKPFLGHAEILLSIKAVKAVSDVIGLNRAIEELRDLTVPPNRPT